MLTAFALGITESCNEAHVTEVVVYSVGVAHRREVYRRILNRR
jgi:hypothetical protein